MAEVTLQTRFLHHLGDASCKTIDVIADELQLTRHQISVTATSLIRRDYLERVERGCFQLTASGRQAVLDGVEITSGPNGAHSKVKAPLRHTLRQRAWNVIRIQRRFTIPDLLTTAALGSEKIAQNNLQRYCRGLCSSGILRKLPHRQKDTTHGSNGFVQYVLMKDLGSIAPVYRPKTQTIFDHNSGKELSA